MATKLTNIKIKGLKGGTIEYAIAPSLFLSGRNAAGKTRVFDAIQLLVNGYHPNLPKKGDGIMRLAEGDELYVEGRFESEHGTWTIARRWDRTEVSRGKDKGGIKVSSSIIAFDRSGKKLEKSEAEAMIKLVAGEPFAIDISELISKTDSGRRNLLFRIGAQQAGWTPEVVADILSSANTTPPVKPFKEGMNLVEWLDQEYADAKERTSAARALVAMRREAAAKLGEDASAVEPADVGVLRRAHEAAQQRSREVAADWAKTIEKARNEHNAGLTLAESRRRTKDSLDAAQAEERTLLATPAADNSGEIKRLQDQINNLEDDLDGIPALREDLESVTKKETRAAARERETAIALSRAEDARLQAFSATTNQLAPQSEELDALRSKCNTLSNFGQRIEGSINDIAAQIATLEGDGFDDPACPTCGQTVSPEALEKFTDRKLELQREAWKIEQQLVATQAEYDSALTAAKKQIAEELNTALQLAVDVEYEARQAHDAAVKELHALIARKTSLITELSRKNNELLTTKERLRSLQSNGGTNERAGRLAVLRERIEKAEAQLATPAPDCDTLGQIVATTAAQATAAKEKANAAATEAFNKLKSAEDLLTLYREAARIRQELADAEAELTECKRIEDALGPKGLMGKVVASVIGPFEDAVNACIEGLDLGRFEVRMQDERENEVFHLGLVRDGQFAPIETLCNGEGASIQAAVLVGLASLADAPWKPVQADHMERLDFERRTAFLTRLVELQKAGKVDQVLAAGCPDVSPAIPGLDVVMVGGVK